MQDDCSRFTMYPVSDLELDGLEGHLELVAGDGVVAWVGLGGGRLAVGACALREKLAPWRSGGLR